MPGGLQRAAASQPSIIFYSSVLRPHVSSYDGRRGGPVRHRGHSRSDGFVVVKKMGIVLGRQTVWALQPGAAIE